MKSIKCTFCGETLTKDLIGLNKKLHGKTNTKTLCLPCLADYIGCTEDDLLIKIEEYKEQGCTLFK